MSYRRDPVPENRDDLRRYIDNEFRKLEDETDAIEQVLALLESAGVERAIIRESTTLTGAFLTDYADGFIPDPPILSTIPQEISFDRTAGTITIGYDGIYDVTGYVLQTAGTNQAPYAWAVDINGTSNFIIGTQVFTNAANGSVFSASASIDLLAGDVLRLETIDTLTGITVGDSNLEVRLVDPGNNQAWGTRRYIFT